MCRVSGHDVLLVVRVIAAEHPVPAAVIVVGHARFYAFFVEMAVGAGVELGLLGQAYVAVELVWVGFWQKSKVSQSVARVLQLLLVFLFLFEFMLGVDDCLVFDGEQGV